MSEHSNGHKKPTPIDAVVEQPPVHYRCQFCGKVNPDVTPLLAPPPAPNLPAMVMFKMACCSKLLCCQLAGVQQAKPEERRIIAPGA